MIDDSRRRLWIGSYLKLEKIKSVKSAKTALSKVIMELEIKHYILFSRQWDREREGKWRQQMQKWEWREEVYVLKL